MNSSLLNSTVRSKLSELVLAHGRLVSRDPQRCEALLRDYCGASHGAAIKVLLLAVEEGITQELLKSTGDIPPAVLLARYAERLERQWGMSPEIALGVIETWAAAFRIQPQPSSRWHAHDACHEPIDGNIATVLPTASIEAAQNLPAAIAAGPPSQNAHWPSGLSDGKPGFAGWGQRLVPLVLLAVVLGAAYYFWSPLWRMAGDERVTNANDVQTLKLRLARIEAEYAQKLDSLNSSHAEHLKELQALQAQWAKRDEDSQGRIKEEQAKNAEKNTAAASLAPPPPQALTRASLRPPDALGNSKAAKPEKVILNSIGMKLVLIPPGLFQMGSPDSDSEAFGDEKPQHPVRITQPFYLGQTEVTQGQWKRVMNTEPWKKDAFVTEGVDYPAVFVSWDDATEFCRRLSAQDGHDYRLPTEAQWEYACRGGTNHRWNFGDSPVTLSDYGWWGVSEGGNAKGAYARQVGQKLANPFGLYDMHGNVSEWSRDAYDGEVYKKRSGTTTDPWVNSPADKRLVRGGSWHGSPRSLRSAYRSGDLPQDLRTNFIGFRVSRAE